MFHEEETASTYSEQFRDVGLELSLSSPLLLGAEKNARSFLRLSLDAFRINFKNGDLNCVNCDV